MNTKETRCTAAIQYRKNGANCAQSLLAAFSDIMNITEAQALAMGAGWAAAFAAATSAAR